MLQHLIVEGLNLTPWSLETGSETTGDDEEEDKEEFDWQLEQELYTDRSEEELGAMQKYGFANQRSGVFARLQVGFAEKHS